MRFVRHSLYVVLGALLLLPMAAPAQQAKPKKPQSGQQAAPSSDQQAAPQAGQEGAQEDSAEAPAEAPIEPVLSGPYPTMSKAAEDRARQIFQMFDQGNLKGLWNSYSDGRKAAMLRKPKQSSASQPAPSPAAVEEKFIATYKKIRERTGNELAMLEENITPYPFAPDTIYSRLSRLSNVQAPVMFTITVNQKGQIDLFDFKVLPEHIAEGQYAGYEDNTKLNFPFKGEWLVLQGGRNLFDNMSAGSDDTRYTYEFAYLKNGRLFSGSGANAKLTDYYCYGQPIVAPADGEVSRAIAGFDDSPPGKPLGDPPDGNLIVISHGDGESSMMNHLKQNSIKVKRGDKVKQGDVVAECGNSGSGVLPHIHYQLQKHAGMTLPAQFVDYVADGKEVASGEPKKGQSVKNGARSASADDKASQPASSGKADSTKATSPSPIKPTQSPSH